jgi:hypothetical protein
MPIGNNFSQQRFGASGVDGISMSISNAAVQQFRQDVNYLALELNLYISISIGIGTGLDVKKFPTWRQAGTLTAMPPRAQNQSNKFHFLFQFFFS